MGSHRWEQRSVYSLKPTARSTLQEDQPPLWKTAPARLISRYLHSWEIKIFLVLFQRFSFTVKQDSYFFFTFFSRWGWDKKGVKIIKIAATTMESKLCPFYKCAIYTQCLGSCCSWMSTVLASKIHFWGSSNLRYLLKPNISKLIPLNSVQSLIFNIPLK